MAKIQDVWWGMVEAREHEGSESTVDLSPNSDARDTAHLISLAHQNDLRPAVVKVAFLVGKLLRVCLDARRRTHAHR